MIEVLDNYLPTELFNEIRKTLLSSNFPWFYNDSIVDSFDPTAETNESFHQMTHLFYSEWEWNSHFKNLVIPILNQMNVLQPLRIKANLTFKADKNYETGWHVDYTHKDKIQKCKSAVFYLNTTNGKTLFKDGREVDCIENRMVIFDNSLENSHSGTMATDEPRRVVLNFNWMEY